MSDWKNYLDEPPTIPGVYEWRVSSISTPGIILIVSAHLRVRWAGHQEVLSPSFDYWDGYRITVPKGLQWRIYERNGRIPISSHERKILSIEGLTISKCPYCEKVPAIKGNEVSYYGGMVVNPNPQHLNSWNFECCSWSRTPYFSDPREIEKIRRKAFENIIKEYTDGNHP